MNRSGRGAIGIPGGAVAAGALGLSSPGPAELKARQTAKIKEVCEALIACGYASLDEQADVLGLARSTAWTVLKATHKNSGLSAATINRMLAAPRLPVAVRDKIIEYVIEKKAGLYGDTKTKLRRFTTRLSGVRLDRLQGLTQGVRSGAQRALFPDKTPSSKSHREKC